jgi:NADPH2:quinone reductase
MTQAWRMIARSTGGPEVIKREAFDRPSPAAGEVLIAQDAIGLNFIDTYYRSGLYAAPLPLTLGVEGAGYVAALGAGVGGLQVGDKVGAAGGLGAYSTHRIVAADRVRNFDDAIGTDAAAAMMLKGMTACALAEDVLPLESGQVALVHAAAGGVGSVLVPWLRDKGVIVIAHSGSAKKAATVTADHSLYGPFSELADQVRALTGGRGADVVYDGVGKDSWSTSLASLKRRGMMVSYGNASGPVPPVTLLELSRAGSLYVTRPTVFDYVATREELDHVTARLFERMQRGVVRPLIGQRFALSDVAEAHRQLEARQTVGSTVLVP